MKASPSANIFVGRRGTLRRKGGVAITEVGGEHYHTLAGEKEGFRSHLFFFSFLLFSFFFTFFFLDLQTMHDAASFNRHWNGNKDGWPFFRQPKSGCMSPFYIFYFCMALHCPKIAWEYIMRGRVCLSIRKCGILTRMLRVVEDTHLNYFYWNRNVYCGFSERIYIYIYMKS